MTQSKNITWLLALAVVAVLTASTYVYTSADRVQRAVTIEFHANAPMSGYLGEIDMDAVLLYRPKAFSIDLEQIARVIPHEIDDKAAQGVQAARIRDVNRLIDHTTAAYTPFQKTALELLESRNYHDLETLARESWENGERTANGDWLANAFYVAFRQGVGKRDVPGMQGRREQIERWHSDRPDSAYALTALLRITIDLAWAHRGSSYNHKVARKDRANTAYWMEEADKIAQELVRRDDLDSAMLNQLMNVSSSIAPRGLPGSARHKLSVFALAKRSAQLEPDFHHVFLTAARRTLPRWGGSQTLMEELLRRVAADLPEEHRAETYYRMANSILVKNGSREYVKFEFDWSVLNAGYQAMAKRWANVDAHRHEFAALAYLHDMPRLAKQELMTVYAGWNYVAKRVWLHPEAMLAVQQWAVKGVSSNHSSANETGVIAGLRAVGQADAEGIESYLAKGGDVDAHDETGRSLLQIAVKRHNPAVAYALISAGANITATNSKGWQAVHYAANYGSSSMLFMLEKAGAALDARTKVGDTPLNLAANNANRGAFRWLLEHAQHTVNEAGDKGYTPLLHVAYDGHYDMAGDLLAVDGIELNSKTFYGDTALHQASRRGNTAVVRLLLAAGADPRILNGRNSSVLAVARKSGNQALVQMLEEEGLVLVSGVTDEAVEESNALLAKANVLYTKGDMRKAAELSRQAIDLYPKSKNAHIGLALALFMEKDYQPALESIQTAIDIDPQDAELYYKAGRFAFSIGDKELSMDYFAKYLEMAPDTFNAKDLLQRLPELAT